MTALEAIEQSIRENRIVTVDLQDLTGRMNCVAQLQGDADDEVESIVGDDVWVEYWGTDEDTGSSWRVHVRQPRLQPADMAEYLRLTAADMGGSIVDAARNCLDNISTVIEETGLAEDAVRAACREVIDAS